MRYFLNLLGLALFCLAIAGSGDEGPEAQVTAYLDGFNDRVQASELVSRYWHSQVTVYGAGSMQVLADASAVARWLAGVQQAIVEEGWVRSETLESTVCRTGGQNALYALRFLRQFSDGRSTPGAGVYILIRQDRWRIAGVILTDPDRPLTCTP